MLEILFGALLQNSLRRLFGFIIAHFLLGVALGVPLV